MLSLWGACISSTTQSLRFSCISQQRALHLTSQTVYGSCSCLVRAYLASCTMQKISPNA